MLFFCHAENNAKFCGITSLSACIFPHAIFIKGAKYEKAKLYYRFIVFDIKIKLVSSDPKVLRTLKAATDRTFPVPRNIPRNVPLFLVSLVFLYSMGEQGKVKRNHYFSAFFGIFLIFFSILHIFLVILYLPKPKI